MVAKIKAALDARQGPGPGHNGADGRLAVLESTKPLKRESLPEAGADVIFVEAPAPSRRCAA